MVIEWISLIALSIALVYYFVRARHLTDVEFYGLTFVFLFLLVHFNRNKDRLETFVEKSLTYEEVTKKIKRWTLQLKSIATDPKTREKIRAWQKDIQKRVTSFQKCMAQKK